MAPRRSRAPSGRVIIRTKTNIFERKIKVVTEQNVIAINKLANTDGSVTSDKPSPVEQFPMREWSLKVFLLDEDGNERPADVFTKVVYNLHPTFENPVQSFTKAPFTCKNEGWGEFEISIDCYTTEKTKLAPIVHDLNFQRERYEEVHTVTFKNPSQSLQERLRETGPLPTDDDHRPKKKGLATKKSSQKFDYEKIAESLEKLEEEDLLRVIQIINENKGPDTYIRSDVEGDQPEWKEDQKMNLTFVPWGWSGAIARDLVASESETKPVLLDLLRAW
ncbi:transcription initiation factor tfiid tfiif subunit [Fusarium avenaceum]|nr:transcription initiation factor tfiid tfiif subunit [Fusarium avenaceum]